MQQLQLHELQQLSSTSEGLLVPQESGPAGTSRAQKGAWKQQQQQDGHTGRHGRVLSNVSNVEHNARSKAQFKALAGGSSSSNTSPHAGRLEVCQLGAAGAALNRRKLQDMLLVFGAFPARYRRLIW